MDKKELQEYCLNLMGITQYVRRELIAAPKIFPHLILIDESEKENNRLSLQKTQLLTKMLAALKWENHNTTIEYLSLKEPTTVQKSFDQKINDIQPTKILIFGFDIGKILQSKKTIPIAEIPSLSTLLIDVNAKKTAWKTMQRLI